MFWEGAFCSTFSSLYGLRERGDSAPGEPSFKAMSTDMGMLDELSKSVTATKEKFLRPWYTKLA